MRITLDVLKTTLASGIVWIFIVAYFIDAANLDDLLAGTSVIHPDTVETQGGGQLSAARFCVQNTQRILPHQSDRPPTSNSQKARIIVDQDSPSLAAEYLVTPILSNPLSGDRHQVVDSYRSAASRHLLNCAFLI